VGILAGLVFVGCYQKPDVAVENLRDKGARPRQRAADPNRIVGPEEQLCRQFMTLKNAHDPQAEQLLAPRPAVPTAAVSPSEADRLNADIMLHQDFTVQDVYPDAAAEPGAPHMVLVTRGSVSSDRILVQTATGTEASQRAMFSPDLIVEVRDGKIHGVRPQLHED
jgi:hypothetical protein